MIRRYRMPFAMDDPTHPHARVPSAKMSILRPNGVRWVLVEHNETHVTIDADTSDDVHALLLAAPNVEEVR